MLINIYGYVHEARHRRRTQFYYLHQQQSREEMIRMMSYFIELSRQIRLLIKPKLS